MVAGEVHEETIQGVAELPVARRAVVRAMVKQRVRCHSIMLLCQGQAIYINLGARARVTRRVHQRSVLSLRLFACIFKKYSSEYLPIGIPYEFV
jgi:hypothetical protein